MNLKLNIKELGKIKNSKIGFKPFTILFGESNTNKSYTLFSMYYVYKFFFEKEVIDKITNEFSLKERDIKVVNCEKIKENIELKKHIKDLINVFCERNKDKKIKKIEIDINSFKNNINKLFFKGVNEFFEYLINYNPNFKGKLHIPKSNFKILNKKVEKINIYYVYEREYLEYMLTFENQNLKKEIFFSHSWRNLLHRDENYLKYKEDYKNIFYFALPTLLKHFKLIKDNKDKYKLKRLYFFPPSRSAIIDMQKSLLGLYIRDIPIYSGMVKEFLKTYLPDFNIIASSNDNFLDIEFKNIINEIFEGEINIEHEKMETFYTHQNVKIPISASASSIRELTPFYITLRYYPIENKIFFIEEPEAHLHPSLQKKIAYLLAYIVNKGGKVYITTHSDYLVNTISNLVKIWYLKKKNKEKAKAIMKKYNIKEEFLINPKKLGVYFFNKNEKEEVKIEEIKPSENGISPESFLKVMEEDIELSQDILEAFAEVEE